MVLPSKESGQALSQTQSECLGMLSDLHSTLWELKASFSENVKAWPSCILFFPCSAWRSTLCSVEETDFNPSQLNTSVTPCQPQQASKQTNKRPEETREESTEEQEQWRCCVQKSHPGRGALSWRV